MLRQATLLVRRLSSLGDPAFACRLHVSIEGLFLLLLCEEHKENMKSFILTLWLTCVATGTLFSLSPLRLLLLRSTTLILQQEQHEEDSFSVPTTTTNNAPILRDIVQLDNKTNSTSSSAFDYNPDRLPSWLNEYRRWHSQHTQQVNIHNWQDYRYLIVSCAHVDRGFPKCGGASDRLRSMAVNLRLAYVSHRILLIHWTRPCRLQEFLIPNSKLDWRVPSWMEEHVLSSTTKHYLYTKSALDGAALQRLAMYPNTIIVKNRLQWNDAGASLYGTSKTLFPDSSSNSTTPSDFRLHGKNFLPSQESSNPYPNEFRSYYHDLFRMMFRPAPSVQAVLEDYLDVNYNLDNKSDHDRRLIPGQYTAVHHRAYYTTEQNIDQELSLSKLNGDVQNAIHCALSLQKGHAPQPIYFASDSVQALDMAEEYGKEHNLRVVIRTPMSGVTASLQSSSPPQQEQQLPKSVAQQQQEHGFWHLDMVDRNLRPSTAMHNKSTYYYDYNTTASIPDDQWKVVYPHLITTFVDLLLLGNANGVAFGDGGFGRWASWISWNVTNVEQHFRRKERLLCHNPFLVNKDTKRAMTEQ